MIVQKDSELIKNSRKKLWIYSEFAKQIVNSWYIRVMDSEFANQKVNLYSIREKDYDFVVNSRDRC